MATVHFLLAYSHSEQRLLEQHEFTDSKRATKAYAEAEAAHAGDSNYEIVLIGSDSIQTIMKTHGHYFSHERDDMLADLSFS
ncbi:hypothetical protein RWH43_10700 [Microbacterium sp. KSW2-21]|uniref:DUF3892 domain-containing protein n=1 Tax=Microbacterium algihabitans TaxID=3075992 RepID=A0ABU3RWF8_9MICO|nr:hypothetical protein [Microbacterium sp. KSW2-21]MDU0327223.1 hypothetical protein [Microbacterium sp. KSW2-21]